MKRILSIILVVVLSLCMFAGCATTEKEQPKANAVYPLPETLDIKNLENCTVAVSLEKGGMYVDDSGNRVMNLTVYSYEMYDMADIASLEENSVIVRQNEEIKVTELERLDTGLVRINGGEENGGFDLISNDNTVYYEIGMDDIKSYYELGKVTLPVADEFEYIDNSDLDAAAKQYYAEDLLEENKIEYDFYPNNTSVVIENGAVTKMTRIYMP